MTVHTIHAYTETNGAPYPGYVSVTEQPDGSEQFGITVRERGHNGLKAATLPLSREQALRMANDIIAALGHRRG